MLNVLASAPLHAKNAAYQAQLQQAVNSHLFRQTGHYATVKETSVFLVIAVVVIAIALVKALLGKLS